VSETLVFERHEALADAAAAGEKKATGRLFEETEYSQMKIR
jgi:hypothetical protein